MEEIRRLHLENLEDAITEAEGLLTQEYERHGKWTLGQICRHLRLVQDPGIDRYPRDMRRSVLRHLIGDDGERNLYAYRRAVVTVEL